MTDHRKIVNSATSLAEMHRLLDKLFAEHRYLEIEWRVQERQRTLTQNQALHLWFQWLAETLNDAGLDMRVVIREDVNIPWSKDAVKDYIWRPVQKAMLNKESTTEANRTDYTEVREKIADHLTDRWPGLEMPPWPSVDREAWNGR